MSTYPIVDWMGLYGEGWGEDIVPEAFSHPAKYSRALIRHIYQYLIDNELLKRGQRVIDPFGGVALGALDAQLQGLHWVGCELEPKFVELGNANLALWRTRYAPHFPHWGSAVLVQGDSRRIGEVVRGAGGIISSPPYAVSDMGGRGGEGPQAGGAPHVGVLSGAASGVGYGSSPGQLGAMASGDVNAILSSPPYADQPTENGGALTGWEGKRRIGASQNENEGYGESEGQLGSMPPGDVNAIIASPPFGSHDSAGPESLHTRTDESAKAMLNAQGWNGGGQVSEDNLATLPEDNFDAVISSPPFIQTSGGTNVTSPDGPLSDPSLISRHSAGNAAMHGYGEAEGQMQAMKEGDIDAIIASPPFAQTNTKQGGEQGKGWYEGQDLSQGMNRLKDDYLEYSNTPGQLANAPEGRFDSVVSSPPYAGSDPSASHVQGLSRIDPASPNYRPFAVKSIEEGYNEKREYGETDGQLGSIPSGDFESVVSSPPYEGNDQRGGHTEVAEKKRVATHGYGETDGNIGNEEGDTFWGAALQIVTECYKLLAPGSVAVWICKDYVRNKKRVPFSDQWRQLCEKVGFTTLTEVHAWVVEDNGTQLGMLETQDKHHKTERKSFFRRLAEKKGSPRIDWETVWIMRK